jgi:hypothetical protein
MTYYRDKIKVPEEWEWEYQLAYNNAITNGNPIKAMKIKQEYTLRKLQSTQRKTDEQLERLRFDHDIDMQIFNEQSSKLKMENENLKRKSDIDDEIQRQRTDNIILSHTKPSTIYLRKKKSSKAKPKRKVCKCKK